NKPTPGSAEVKEPGTVTRIDHLPKGHRARRFFGRVGLNADRIGKVYDVGYCRESKLSIARGRLIIPVRQDGQLKGWQALRIDTPEEDEPTPRYFTSPGMHRSQLLYNLDRAKEYETGVIVAEPLDVWVFGPMAVSPFGLGMSDTQRRLF